MELRQLRYFVEVSRLKSFSAASKSLYITQSTISQQIGKLEEELGVELLTRDTRHVSLSDYGREFYPHAVRILEEAQVCADKIMDVKDLQTGTLSVGATYSFGPLLMQTILDFHRQYPHVKLNVFNTSTSTRKQMLLDRELDVALTYKSPMDDDRIDSCLLFENSLCLIGRRDAMKECRQHVEVQTLSRYPLALPIKGLQARDTLESVLFAKNVELDIRLELNSIHAILDLVKSGSIFTILSGEVAHGIPELRAVPIHHPEGRMYGCYHFMKGAYRKRATDAFIRILTENNSFRSVFR